jgi:hypothetical protein
MSTDPEESSLEQALRADLPSEETAARLRRRLLAAGVALGGTAAATTAAAGGAAGNAAAASGGASGATWGLASWSAKLGLAAAVAIPAVGLLAERTLREPTVTTHPASARASARLERSARPPVHRSPPAPTEAPTAAVSARSAAPVLLGAKPEPAPAAAEPPRPSQSAFEGFEAPERPSAPPSTLAEETRLLDAAFVDLAAGRYEQAATLIGEHEARFPSGLLRRERERAKARLADGLRGQ